MLSLRKETEQEIKRNHNHKINNGPDQLWPRNGWKRKTSTQQRSVAVANTDTDTKKRERQVEEEEGAKAKRPRRWQQAGTARGTRIQDRGMAGWGRRQRKVGAA